MANVWKRVTHRTPPPSATIGRPNRDGVAVAKWTDSKGNKHSRDVSKASDGTWRLMMENYSVKYRDHRDILVTETTKFKNKELAERYLSEKLDLAERVRSGRISASELRTLDRAGLPMSQLADEFLATISRKAYRDTTAIYLKRFLETNPNIRPVEIDCRCCQRWIDSLVADGAGSSTLSACRATMSRFTRFLYQLAKAGSTQATAGVHQGRVRAVPGRCRISGETTCLFIRVCQRATGERSLLRDRGRLTPWYQPALCHAVG